MKSKSVRHAVLEAENPILIKHKPQISEIRSRSSYQEKKESVDKLGQ